MKSQITKIALATIGSTVMLAGNVSAQEKQMVKENESQPKIVPFNGVSGLRTWSVGFFGGGALSLDPFGGPYYYNNYSTRSLGYIYGGYLRKQLSHNFALEADFLRGVVNGRRKIDADGFANSINDEATDVKRYKTNINWGVSLNAVYNFGTVNWLHDHVVFVPYVSIGGGSMNYKTKVGEDGNTVVRYPGSTKDNRNEFYIPAGVGAKFALSNTINLDINYKLYWVNNTHFDGVDQGNQKDKFSTVQAGIEFALGKSSKPQLIQHNPAYNLASDLWDKNAVLKADLDATNAKHVSDVNDLQGQISALRTELDAYKQDSDHDGVPDAFDKCPNTPSGDKVDGSGCTIKVQTTIINQTITKEDKQVAAEAVRNLEFDFGKATIREHSLESLDRLADLLNTKQHIHLKLAGYTDNVGSAAANLKLSKDRANAIKEYLESKGVDADRIQANGYGKANPIATNKTEAGRQKNRRVEFSLY